MNATRTYTLLSRDTAVQRIADTLADRSSYVITLPPGAAETLAAGLAGIDDWTAYLDNGTDDVLTTSNLLALRLSQLTCPNAGALVIPKTVNRRSVGRLVNQPIPPDGSKDVIVLTGHPGQPALWPLLFVDAIDLVDPITAARLRAHGTG